MPTLALLMAARRGPLKAAQPEGVEREGFHLGRRQSLIIPARQLRERVRLLGTFADHGFLKCMCDSELIEDIWISGGQFGDEHLGVLDSSPTAASMSFDVQRTGPRLCG